ncbi:hypothetical protein BsWGS_27788 [Bradybaena similaris]
MCTTMWKLVLTCVVFCVTLQTVNGAPCSFQLVCDQDYAYVCGTNGQTYQNACEMFVATCGTVNKAYDGDCDNS